MEKPKEKYILLVDDDPTQTDLLRDFLKGVGYNHILAAIDGEECLKVFAQYGEDINLIVLNVTMPRMNGLEVMRTLSLREKSTVTGVIMLTGMDDAKVAIEFKGLGTDNIIAVDYILKPFDIEHLLAVIEGGLDQVQTKRQSLQQGRMEKSAENENNSNFTFDEFCRVRARKHQRIDHLTSDDLLNQLDELRKWIKRAFRRWERPITVFGVLGLGLFLVGSWFQNNWLRGAGFGMAIVMGFQFTKLEYYWKGYSSGYDAGYEDGIPKHKYLGKQADETREDGESRGIIKRTIRKIPRALRPWLIMFPALYIIDQMVPETAIRWVLMTIIVIGTAIFNVTIGTDETSDID